MGIANGGSQGYNIPLLLPSPPQAVKGIIIRNGIETQEL